VRLHLDFETRSAVTALGKAGVWNYSHHPTTDVWCACYAIDDGPIRVWLPGEAVPRDLREALKRGTVVAHNAMFEWHIIEFICAERYGWPTVELDRLDDTAARAAVQAIPRDLARAAPAMGIPLEKDMDGRRVMLQMAKPRRPRKGEDPTILYWWDDEDRLSRLIDYCKRDVEVERALDEKLMPLSKRESKLWLADARANLRGIRIDTELVEEADKLVRESLRRYGCLLSELTGGAVTAVTQHGRLIDWLQSHGVQTDSVAKDVVEELLGGGTAAMPPLARRVLEIRKEAAKSSTAKLDAFRQRVSADGRMRENLLYHGAGTGRWAGRGVQLQNLPRPELDAPGVTQAIQIIKRTDLSVDQRIERIEFLLGSAPTVVADCLRGCLIAENGHTLRVADYSNIEGRGGAWVAGENWKMEAFRAFDRGEGPDLYKVAAGGIFGIEPAEIGKDFRRQIGKVSELALQYEGGVGAYGSMAKVYGLDMGEHYQTIVSVADPDKVEYASKAHKTRGHRFDMPVEAWVASEVTKLAWREKHPRIKASWRGLEGAAIEAMDSPGVVATFRGVRYYRPTADEGPGTFLICQLPSKRCIYYPDPRVRESRTPWGTRKRQLTYMRTDPVTKKWLRAKAYGGLLFENVVQATARDVMAVAILRLEKAGYPVLLTIHDEIIAETPADKGSQHEFEALMAQRSKWAEGLPVAVEGFAAVRYKKAA